MRQAQAADDGDAERLAQFGAGTGAERDRQRAEDGGKSRHHDRPEAQQTGLADRGLGRQADAAAFEREVDHHDGVFLDDADQHDDADHGDDRQIHFEQDQRQQRADAGRRQTGDDRDRVDEAFVQDAEHDEGREHRGDDEDALPLQGFLEHLGVALEAGDDRGRQVRVTLDDRDGIGRLTERSARRHVERDGDRGLLALVVDLKRTDARHQSGDGAERDRLAVRRRGAVDAGADRRAADQIGDRGLDEDLRQAGRIDLILGIDLQNDLVVVDRRVDGRDLAGAEGVVEFLPDLIDRDAVDRRFFAVDLDRDLRVLDVEVAVDVAQEGQRGDLLAHDLGAGIERLGVAGLQRVLVFALGDAAAEIDVLDGAEIGLHADDGADRLAQAIDHDRRRLVTLLLRFQADEDAAGIVGRVRPADADRRVNVVHRLVGADDVGDFELTLLHRPERDIGRTFHSRRDEAGVLDREEALRDHNVEPDRADHRQQRHHQRDGFVAQHQIERALIGAMPCIEHRLEDTQDRVLLLAFVMRPQHPGAQHRRQRQRHEAGDDDGDRDGDREFAEHAADHAAHQQDGNKHGNQRERDRDDGETDFARALERRLERPHAAFDVTHDVLEHDDGVVDHEADRQRQCQQRHVVDGEVERVHHRAGSNQRDRHRQ